MIEIEEGKVVEQVIGALGRQPDIVIDCTPVSLSAVTDAVNMVARKGTIVLAGVKPLAASRRCALSALATAKAAR